MRAHAACQVTLRRSGAWRAAIAALTLIATLALAAWLAQQPAPPSSIQWMMFAGGVGCIMAAASLWRVPQGCLRWDGREWTLDDRPGTLAVALDLGPWMLLRYAPEGGGRSRWLPLQRHGLEEQWHALRCAVHAS